MTEQAKEREGQPLQNKERPIVRDIVMLVLGALATYAVTYIIQSDASAKQLENARKERAMELYAEYEGLSDITPSAVAFARGQGGNEQDFIKIYRHFRRVAVLVSVDRVQASEIGNLYRGRLSFWGDLFEEAGKSPQRFEWEMSDTTLNQIRSLAGFLLVVHEEQRSSEISDFGESSATLDFIEDLDEAAEATEDEIFTE